MKAYTYILECADGSFYTGWTDDLKARLEKHNSGRGAKYTRGRLPVTLIYFEVFPDKRSAMRREYAVKRLTRLQKEALVSAARPGLFEGHQCHIVEHQDEMAETPAHNEEVENFMGAESFVPAVENGQLQSIDNASNGVDDASGQEPSEGSSGQGIENLGERQNAHPAHGDIQH